EGETESYLWAFVGNMTDGFKMVNNTGLAIKSENKGNPVLASVEEATAWVPAQSQANGSQYFCFKYPAGNYMNAQSGKIAHWSDNDAGSTLNVVEAETYTINYTYTYELNEVQYEVGTSSTTVCVGCPYPAVSAPFGFGAETPKGKVLADETRTIACKDNLPFEYAATVDAINSWYYMQMHSNNWHYIKRAGSGLTWADTEVAEDEKNSYAWAFVGDPINGFKVVNQAAGIESALKSTGNNSDAVTLTTFADATPLWVKPTSQNVVGGFCLKPANGNYINATDGTVKHWGDNDAGSTIMVIAQSAIELEALVNRLNGTIDAMIENAGIGIGYYESAEDVAKLKKSIEKAQALLESNSKKNEDYVAAIAELKELETKAAKIELPEAGKYYRIGYDFGSEVGIKYMQSVNSSEKGLNMTSESEVMSVVFYYVDGKLQSLDTKGYLKENGDDRGLQDDADKAGTITFSAGSELGKIKIQAPSYLHANKSGENYFIDHCGDDKCGANHNFVITEVKTEELNELCLKGSTYITALDYKTNINCPVIVNNARSNWAVAEKPLALRTLYELGGWEKNVADTKQQFAIITP
ncbi:MAG: hypothetical protein IKU98_02365, partial [Bacteroidaceae bacterium]|nr:hypothetical protein [Bacteroidaceae bacterium]